MAPSTVGVVALVWLGALWIATATAAAFRSWSPSVTPALLFLVACAVRLPLAWVFRMPASGFAHFDLQSFEIVARLARMGADVYGNTPRHPYLPFELYVLGAASWLAERTGVAFEVLAKLPAVFADAAIPWVLATWPTAVVARIRARRAAVVYALNPLSIVVVALHGQFDSLPLLLALLAVRCLADARPSDPAVRRAGVLAGLAILAKTWPVMLVPLLGLQGRTWRQRAVLFAGVVLVPVAGVAIYCALFRTGPGPLIYSVGTYSSVARRWGYPLVLWRLFYRSWGWQWAESVYLWMQTRSILILAVGLAAATLAALRKPLEYGCVMVILAFYLCTPGWGAHYLVWAEPLILCVAPWRLAAAYVLSASLLLIIAFFFLGGFYMYALQFHALSGVLARYAWVLSLPVWGVCVALFVTLARERRR